MLTVWTLKGGQEELNKVIKGLVSTNNMQWIDSFGAQSNMQVTMVMGAVNQWKTCTYTCSILKLNLYLVNQSPCTIADCPAMSFVFVC